MSSKLMKVTTSDGKHLSIPILGLGTYEGTNGGHVYQTVKEAIDCGYRHFDCALVYGNEEEVGKALKEAIDEKKVSREELFIVSKLWMTYTRIDRVIKCIELSLKKLQMSYLDLYLLHWPLSFEQQDQEMYPKDKSGNIIEDEYFSLVETWKGMEELVIKGLTKSIGLSNCNSKQVQQILDSNTCKPLAHQIEVHPYLPNTKLIDFCHSHSILVFAYSPLGEQATPGQREKTRKEAIEDPLVKKIGDKYKKNAIQVLIRFAIDRGLIVVAKTSSKERLNHNMNVWDFSLTEEEIKQLEALDCGFRSCEMNIPEVPEHKNYPFQTGIEF